MKKVMALAVIAMLFVPVVAFAGIKVVVATDFLTDGENSVFISPKEYSLTNAITLESFKEFLSQAKANNNTIKRLDSEGWKIVYIERVKSDFGLFHLIALQK